MSKSPFIVPSSRFPTAPSVRFKDAPLFEVCVRPGEVFASHVVLSGVKAGGCSAELTFSYSVKACASRDSRAASGNQDYRRGKLINWHCNRPSNERFRYKLAASLSVLR